MTSYAPGYAPSSPGGKGGSAPSSPGGKGGGSNSSQPSSPGGKGGSSGGYNPEPSPSYGGGAPTSPGGKGGPSTFNSFPDPNMGRGASPGGKGGGGYGPDDRPMPQQQYQQPFQQQFGNQFGPGQFNPSIDNTAVLYPASYYKQQQPQFQQQQPFNLVDRPKQQQSPYQQQMLREMLQGTPQQPQFQQQTNTDLLRRLGNPMPGTPEHNLRYPEIGTPEFEQLHGPGANAEAQRPRELGPITTMPVSPPPESVAEEYNPAQRNQLSPAQRNQLSPAQRNPNMQKTYMPQGQMTPEQQRMQNIMGSYGGGGYGQQQPRGITMDMPQQYGRQPQLPQYGQSGLGISQLGAMANMLRGNPMQQMQQPQQNPYQAQLQNVRQYGMQQSNAQNQRQIAQAQQYNNARALQRATQQVDLHAPFSYDPFGGGSAG